MGFDVASLDKGPANQGLFPDFFSHHPLVLVINCLQLEELQ